MRYPDEGLFLPAQRLRLSTGIPGVYVTDPARSSESSGLLHAQFGSTRLMSWLRTAVRQPNHPLGPPTARGGYVFEAVEPRYIAISCGR